MSISGGSISYFGERRTCIVRARPGEGNPLSGITEVMSKITITGSVPSLKNNKIATMNSKTGKMFIRTDARTKKYMEDAKLQVQSQWRQPSLPELEQLTCVVFYPDNRVRDLSNALDTILDVIKGIVVKDDCWKCIPRIQIEFGGVDKDNPRVELWADFPES